VLEPVAEQKRAVLVEVAIVEDEEELATLEAGLAGSVSARVTSFSPPMRGDEFHGPNLTTLTDF